MYEGFSHSSRAALEAARSFAAVRGMREAEPFDVLLGILCIPDPVATILFGHPPVLSALQEGGFRSDALVQPQLDPGRIPSVPWNKSAIKVLEMSLRESLHVHARLIVPGHIALALINPRSGLVSGAGSLALNGEAAVRRRLLRTMGMDAHLSAPDWPES